MLAVAVAGGGWYAFRWLHVARMVEDTPTLGSVESSVARRRQFAAQSMQFGLIHPIARLFDESQRFVGGLLRRCDLAHAQIDFDQQQALIYIAAA